MNDTRGQVRGQRTGSRARRASKTAGLVVALCALVLTACERPAPSLDVIRAAGELRVVTIVSGTTFYEGPQGLTGFEHDLAARFADWLGVEARFIVASDYQDLRRRLLRNQAHIGAALLSVTAAGDPRLHYGPTYAIARQLVVHRRGRITPRNVDDLRGLTGAAVAGRGVRPLLEHELPHAAGYRWTLREDSVVDDLLQDVEQGRLDYAVVPSFDFASARPYYPELLSSIELAMPQAVAWLYRPGVDDSLGRAQVAFLDELRASGELAALETRYFGRDESFDYVESRALLRHYDERLPRYRHHFIDMAARTGLDWVLLAAVAYQESRWQEDARSRTGVRGLMMLTRDTARRFDVDRLDGADSIRGGALYLAEMRDRLPRDIAEPDRTWLALAAYNVGLGHLEDARVLTQRAGRNPDRWADVREFLPRLARREWARRARHGYARGYQAVHFVDNTRRYYQVLRWLEAETVPEAADAPAATRDTVLTPPISPAL